MQPLLAAMWCVCDAPLLAAVRKHPLVQDVKAIVKAFKFKHLTLRTDAVKALQSVLRRCALPRTRPLFDAVTCTIKGASQGAGDRVTPRHPPHVRPEG